MEARCRHPTTNVRSYELGLSAENDDALSAMLKAMKAAVVAGSESCFKHERWGTSPASEIAVNSLELYQGELEEADNIRTQVGKLKFAEKVKAVTDAMKPVSDLAGGMSGGLPLPLFREAVVLIWGGFHLFV